MALTPFGRARRSPRHTARVALLTSAALAASVLTSTVAAQTATAAPKSESHTGGRLFSTPDTALGRGWKSSSDRAVTGTGDSAGFHILVADESKSFTYREVADLTQDGLDGIGPWTGYVCQTGSGRYAGRRLRALDRRQHPLADAARRFRRCRRPGHREGDPGRLRDAARLLLARLRHR